MKHLLVIASVACALSSQTAAAGRAKPPLLTIHYGSETPAATKTVEVYSSGAWVLSTFNLDGSLAGTSRGHLDRQQFSQVRTAVTAAQWITTTSPIACFANSPAYTQYSLYGKVMFTDQQCSGSSLDDTTLRSIATIESVLGLR